MATQRAKKANLKNTRKQVLNSVKAINCTVLDLADNIVDETLATGSKYQKVATNAIRKSEPIIEKQIDMIFDTVEMTIDQVKSNNKRFQKLLGITKQVNLASSTLTVATSQLGKLIKKVSGRVEEEVEEATKSIKTTVNSGRKASTKAVKAVTKRSTKPTASKSTKVVSKSKATKTTKAVAKRTAKPTTSKKAKVGAKRKTTRTRRATVKK